MDNSARRRARARRSAVTLTTAALLGGAAAAPALADGGDGSGGDPGSARATVLQAALDVGLLGRTAEVPLTLSLNDVSAPTGEAGTGSAEKTALTAALDGVDRGRPFSVLRAEAASATARIDEEAARAEVTLADARVHLPGMPLLSVIELEAVTATAVCPAAGAPTAEANVGASVRVLGKRITLTAGGTTDVRIPGVGEVRLDLSHRETTDATAAASALALDIDVDPLDLGVAEVAGRITLAEVSCSRPETGPEPQKDEGPKPQTLSGEVVETDTSATADGPGLAATGGGDRTPYLIGGAGALLVAGSLLAFSRRTRRGAEPGTDA